MKGYKEITDEIISKLKGGTIPWRQTWKSGLPANAISRQPYRGINIWLLDNGKYQSNLWLTFNQTKQLGCSVNKGEHGKQIIYWQITERLQKDELGEEYLRKVPVMKTFTVFNVEQTNVVVEKERCIVDSIQKAQEIIDGYADRPEIVFGEPTYSPELDKIKMPPISAFKSAGEYYSTLFHELSHSTGHEKRLNRNIKNHYGSDPYAEEEIISEMSASYLSGIIGIDVYSKTIDNSIAYIDHWVKRFADNEKLIVSLSSKAQRSSDWILGNRAIFDNQIDS